MNTKVIIGGATVMIHDGPSDAVLKRAKAKRTGEFRRPKRGEHYWFPDAAAYDGGKISKCIGASGMYHILEIEMKEPRFWVDTTGGNGAGRMLDLNEVRALVKKWDEQNSTRRPF